MFDSNDKLVQKWAPVLEHADAPAITDAHKKAVTAQLLENSEIDFAKNTAAQSYSLNEAAPTNAIGNAANGDIATFDPVLISMVRRAMPNLIAYDIAGVQPMTGPTGLIFAMHARYLNAATRAAGTEAFVNEPDTTFSAASRDTSDNDEGTSPTGGIGTQSSDPTGLDFASATDATPAADGTEQVGGGFKLTDIMDTGEGESLGDASTNEFAEMAFTISKVSVEAKTRALKAEYTMELAQDLRAVHGLDAEAELSNILSTEALAEINREVVRSVYKQAKIGNPGGETTTTGIFDLADPEDNGGARWQAERYKTIAVAIQMEANVIAKQTRRGKGNFVICSSDVATALSASGSLAYTSASVEGSLSVDDTGNTFAGMMGSMKVYIDPYAAGNFACIGYRGSNPYDAGIFYCPYVPLTKVRAVGEQTFQPKIGFKTRYGMVANPYVTGDAAGATAASEKTRGTSTNQYFRIFRIDNV